MFSNNGRLEAKVVFCAPGEVRALFGAYTPSKRRRRCG
jgi:hypothetical protein